MVGLLGTSIGSSQVVVCGVDRRHEKGSLSTSCTVSVSHAFVNRMWDGFLLICLVVGLFGDAMCEAFAFFSASSFFGQSRLMVVCPSPQLTNFSVRFLLFLHWLDACLPAQYLQVWTSAKLLSIEAQQWFSDKGPHSETPVPSGKSDGVLFSYQYYRYHVCRFRLLFLVFHMVIRDASSTSLFCWGSSLVTQGGTPMMI